MQTSGELLERCTAALATADDLYQTGRRNVAALVSDGRQSPALIDQHQHAVHGLAWLATTIEGLRQILRWARALENAGRLHEIERLVLQVAFGEYLAQIGGGIPMSQVELLRPHDLGLDTRELARFQNPVVSGLIRDGATSAVRERLARAVVEAGTFGDSGLDDEQLLIQDQFRRYARNRIEPDAHNWHLGDELIPMSVLNDLAEFGVFGLTVPEEFGGLGMSKVAMCIVTEELSRAWIGIGSLGTRTEIAAELILSAGTPEQQQRWLPGIVSGEIIPTAVFTEPGTGSDLGSLKTRAERDGEVYRVTGNKTWITHAARADLMTLLVRTNQDERGYRGLSMLMAEKPRGTTSDAFPAAGMSGGEIPVLGYRGMKEYEIAFDGFEVPTCDLLGREEGQGFKQLMATFETARIQTGARAVGVAQRALELGLAYATERRQFGRALIEFPRVANKIAWLTVETMVARQITWYAARQKDDNRRCDLEAGMAKLLAARVAWANADNALQIHGGNGYAQEFEISRILCDARILNIFEGAAEIQAQVIARRLLADAN